MTPRFEVNDRVKFGEVEGVLEQSPNNPHDHPDKQLVRLRHTSMGWLDFTERGELYGYHGWGTVLTLVEKAKKPTRVEMWLNVYKEEFVSGWYTKKTADMHAINGRLACVPFIYDSEEEHIQVRKKDLADAIYKNQGSTDAVNNVWTLLKEGKT